MTELEKFFSNKISQLIPNYDKLEVRANVSDSSYMIEFFVTINGKRMQCYDMVDDGTLVEKELDDVFESIAQFIRNMSDYKKGEINKISFVLDI